MSDASKSVGSANQYESRMKILVKHTRAFANRAGHFDGQRSKLKQLCL